jgi:hypothetical protein
MRWSHIQRVLSRKSPYGNETGKLPIGEYNPGTELVQNLHEKAKVLVIGAGGLGCEILKDLALSGITDIHVIGKSFPTADWRRVPFSDRNFPSFFAFRPRHN